MYSSCQLYSVYPGKLKIDYCRCKIVLFDKQFMGLFPSSAELTSYPALHNILQQPSLIPVSSSTTRTRVSSFMFSGSSLFFYELLYLF